jgi:hypothetical protein
MRKRAVLEKVRSAGEVVGPKAREVRDAVEPRARELGEAVAPRVKQLAETVAPKVKTARRKVGFWIAGEEPRKPRRWPAFVAVGMGAVAAFFLDPVSGKRRRSVTRDWVGARFRGVGRGAQTGQESPPENDAALAHKVESELFQGLDIPSGQINVNAEDGVVSLRGVVKRPSQISEVEKRVWEIAGVRGVQNLMHLEGTPAPSG